MNINLEQQTDEKTMEFFGIIERMFEELEGYSPVQQEEVLNYVAGKLKIERYP